LALNFTIHDDEQRQNEQSDDGDQPDRKLWNQVMLSITGVADSCSVISHGLG
jgi:hypothetical protein